MPKSFDQLADWQVGATGPQRLYLRCRNEVAEQVEATLGSILRPRLKVPPEEWDEWTHRYPMTREMTPDQSAFLDAMRRALTFRNSAPASLIVALDQYQDPSTHEDPMLWAKTPLGRLVHEGKYGGSVASLQRLAAEVAWFAKVHGTLRLSDVVVAVPSHSPRRFSERLAAQVAVLMEIPAVSVTDDLREPVKDTDPSTRIAPTFAFERSSIEGGEVLVIDDLIRSGESVRGLVRDLDAAGAEAIRVLAAVKTMRN
jgi:hypothetical protein